MGPSPEPDINVWDIDDMCVVETPAAATPQPTLLEKMKDVTVNEELARLAEYATLEIVVITLPEAKKVCGILRGESYQKPAEGVRFDDTVTEMEHCMFEQEEFERDEEEERKRIERLSRYSSEEEEFERDVEVEDEGDDKEKDEGTDEDSGKESALDAWKRAMEEKTQKMREASSADHEDSKRPFRLQPRAWGTSASPTISPVASPAVSEAEDAKSEEEMEDVIIREEEREKRPKIASKRKVLLDRTKKGNTLGRGFVPPSDDEGETSGGESALDAWKRAMEEKTERMKAAADDKLRAP